MPTLSALPYFTESLPHVSAPPEKSALGKGWGAWGEGEPLQRRRRGSPSPQRAMCIRRFAAREDA